jgi:PAS domain S-box-containing protein
VFYRIEVFVAAFCLVLASSLYLISSHKNAEVANREFQTQVDDHVRTLQTRISTYTQSMKGVAALLNSSEYITVKDFEIYVSSLEIFEQLPGIAGIGLVVKVPHAELEDLVNEMREQNQQSFTLRKLSNEPVHYIIKHMYPEAGNEAAIGLDVTYSKDIKKVLDRARTTRSTLMSHPLKLVQQGVGHAPGFVLYMPVYKRNLSEGDGDGFRGWVEAPFVAENLFFRLSSGAGQSYHLRVVDAESSENSTLLFDSADSETEHGQYVSIREINLFGRTWTLTYNSTPQFDRAFLAFQPIGILIVSLILTILLLMYLRSKRLRAQALSEITALRSRKITAQEEENKAIIENAVTPVFVLDSRDSVVFANQAALNCFGYTHSEIIGEMHFSSLVKDNEDQSDSYNALGKTKSGEILELDVQRNSWKTHDCETRTTAIIRDLTEQNDAQRELKRSRTLFDLALRGAKIGVFDVDLRTGKSQVSQTWCRIMGADDTCEGMDGDTQRFFLSRIHPDDKAILTTADQNCIEGKTTRSIAEYRVKTLDGTWRWMRSDSSAVTRDKNGKATRLVGTQIDVTELRHDKNALESSERKFRQVLAHAPIGMALLDYNGKFTGVNDAFCQMAGMTTDELIDQARLSDLMPYEERKEVYSAITSLMENGSAAVYTAEHRILHAKGGESWGLVNVSWSYDKNTNSPFFIAQIIDITEKKKLDKIKNEFVSTVSHELRTPLTSIKGALGLLTASKTKNFTTAETRLVEIASSNADRLTDIVNDILDLEKISSGELTFNFQDVNFSTMIESTVKDMMPFAVTHKNKLKVELPKEPLVARADQGRARQVLANLISNACKYSDQETEVQIRAEIIEGMAFVYIQNSGPGVPESFKPNIFKAFSQADSSDTRAKGGTGLGLNISRQIVLRHNGQIDFESSPGGVTVFWFAIPVSEPDEQ